MEWHLAILHLTRTNLYQQPLALRTVDVATTVLIISQMAVTFRLQRQVCLE